MKLSRYNVKWNYVPGSKLLCADLLSRAINKEPVVYNKVVSDPHKMSVINSKISDTEGLFNFSVHSMSQFMDVSDCRLQEIRQATDRDYQLQEVIKFIRKGFPGYQTTLNATGQ